MKFATIALLLGAVSAEAPEAQSMWGYDTTFDFDRMNSWTCRDIQKDKNELIDRMRQIPYGGACSNAQYAVRSFYNIEHNMCYKMNSKQYKCKSDFLSEIKNKYDAAIKALNECKDIDASFARHDVNSLKFDYNFCFDKAWMMAEQPESLIKIGIPEDRAGEFMQKFKEIEGDLKKIDQHLDEATLQNEMMQFAQWAEKEHVVENYARDVLTNGNPKVASVQHDLEEAMRILEQEVQFTGNGIEIDNKDIPRLQREFKKLNNDEKAIEGDGYTVQRTEQLVGQVMSQPNFQNVLGKLKKLEHTPEAKALEQDLEELADLIQSSQVITDLPQGM